MGNDTIAAIATAVSDSGIGIIRISGDRAVEVGDRVFRTPNGKRILENVDSHTIHYGYIVDMEEDSINTDLIDNDEPGQAQSVQNLTTNDFMTNEVIANKVRGLESDPKDPDNWKDHIIDEVMVSVMKAPRSFTAEDTVEINCHGGVLVLRRILSLVCRSGARLAEPGEFTKRAFLNGRIDLSKAEAVIDIIHSKNEYALKSSVNQLQGKLSEKIRELRQGIIYEIAFIESALDDPEHISLDGYPERLLKKINEILEDVDKLIATADNGKLIKEGISTVILGKPNVGKSSLLNLLVGEERAIVTDIAGTTRDALQETVNFNGITLNMIDTAGIRDTEDTVEKIGVERAKKYAENADLIFYVVDSSVELDDNDREILNLVCNKKVIILLNKADLIRIDFGIKTQNMGIEKDFTEKIDEETESGLREILDKKGRMLKIVSEEKVLDLIKEIVAENEMDFESVRKNIFLIHTSTKDQTGMDELEQTVKNLFFSGMIKSNDEIIITNLRHKEALEHTRDSLALVRKSIENGMPEDFFSIDLMSAYTSLGLIIGEEVGDDLVEEIFSKFCMGK